MLKAEGLTVRYGAKAAVRDLTLEIREGQWWAVAGPNGAGKSTLVAALGRTVPYEGVIRFRGKDVREIPGKEYAKHVGVLSQNHAAVFGFTVGEVVSLGRYAHRGGLLSGGDPEGGERVAEALARTGLDGMRDRNMLTLSGGERQRVFLAQVLCQDPEILILDEPANHLDLPFQQDLFALAGEWVKTPGRAVVTVTHDLNPAKRFSTHALLMNEGTCAARGETGGVLTREKLTEVYGMDVYGWQREMLGVWE